MALYTVESITRDKGPGGLEKPLSEYGTIPNILVAKGEDGKTYRGWFNSLKPENPVPVAGSKIDLEFTPTKPENPLVGKFNKPNTGRGGGAPPNPKALIYGAAYAANLALASKYAPEGSTPESIVQTAIKLTNTVVDSAKI